jgi:tyrosine-protein kinase Etk/Wzc
MTYQNNLWKNVFKKFDDNFEVDWTDENILEIRVWDVDSKRASEMANYCVDLLNIRNYELQTTEARNTRVFIEQRLSQNKAELAVAEDNLRAYQEKEKMMIPTDVNGGGLSEIASIYGAKAKKEIDLGILKETVGKNNPAYQQTELELKVLESKISKIPELGLTSLRLYREVFIQQKILETIVPLFEQAKVNEHKDIPVAYVLDQAVPGEKPDRPKRIFIVGITFFLGLVGSFVFIGLKEYAVATRKRSPEKIEQFKLFKKIAGASK